MIGLPRAVDIAHVFINLREQNISWNIFRKFAPGRFIFLDHPLRAIGRGINVRQREVAVHVIRIQRQGLLIVMLGATPIFLANAEFRLGNIQQKSFGTGRDLAIDAAMRLLCLTFFGKDFGEAAQRGRIIRCNRE